LSSFEYVSVILSIVIALGIARLLAGVAEVIRFRHTLASKGLYIWWCAFLLTVHVGWWFGVWYVVRPLQEFSLLAVFGYFSVPASLYVASRLLVPETSSQSPESLENRLESIRTPFLFLVAYPWVPGTIGNLASGDVPAALLLASVGVLTLIGIPLKGRFQVPLLAPCQPRTSRS